MNKLQLVIWKIKASYLTFKSRVWHFSRRIREFHLPRMFWKYLKDEEKKEYILMWRSLYWIPRKEIESMVIDKDWIQVMFSVLEDYHWKFVNLEAEYIEDNKTNEVLDVIRSKVPWFMPYDILHKMNWPVYSCRFMNMLASELRIDSLWSLKK